MTLHTDKDTEILSLAEIRPHLMSNRWPRGYSFIASQNLKSVRSRRVKLMLPVLDLGLGEHLITGRLLGDLLSILSDSLPEKAQTFYHQDGQISVLLSGNEWSLEVTTVSSDIVEDALLEVDGGQSHPLSYVDGGEVLDEQTKQQWLRALDLIQRSKSFGVARQPTTAIIHESASIHPTVEVNGSVKVGAQTKVWHFSKLLGPLTIGERCSFGQNVVIEKGVEIGHNVKVQNNVSIYAGVILEDDVFCGPSMVFTNVGTPRSHYPRRNTYSVTRVGRGASIGANATIVCGHSLGQYCFVGAGAVVTKDVPDFALVYGNPARVRGWACYCGVKLQFKAYPHPKSDEVQATCEECSRIYRLKEGKVTALSSL